MNFLKRAWCYVTRRKGKSALLMITFFLIGNLVILGMGISQAADGAKTLTRKSMRAAVRYEIDYNEFWNYIETLEDEDEINQAYENSPRLDRESALMLAGDSRVKAMNFMSTSIGYSGGFENVPLGNEEDRGISTYIDENGNEMQWREPNLMIYAMEYPNTIEMAEGTWTLTDGRFLEDADMRDEKRVVLITKELAEVNGFRVGDEIHVDSMNTNELKGMQDMGLDTSSMGMDLEVVGIYNTLAAVDENSEQFRWMSAYESPKNVIVMPLSTYARETTDDNLLMNKYYAQMYGSEENADEETVYESLSTPSNVVFLLDDPLNVEDFTKDYENRLTQYTKLNANNETFKKMSRPLDTLSFFANIIVWIVVINAVVIITLVTALTLKTREYEIGVLLSMGVSKLKVVGQLFVELIIIALCGFTFAVASGSLMAREVGDRVLKYQTDTEAQYETGEIGGSYYWIGDGNYFTDVSQEQLLANYRVSVSPKLIGEIYLLGTAVVLTAIVIPSFMIMRLNPKQILLEQN